MGKEIRLCLLVGNCFSLFVVLSVCLNSVYIFMGGKVSGSTVPVLDLLAPNPEVKPTEALVQEATPNKP